MSVRKRMVFLALVVGSCAIAPVSALACSICRCGDPMYNALGPDIYATSALRFAVDWDRLNKTQGAATMETSGPSVEATAVPEQVVENRVTAMLSYAFGDRANIVARVPYSWRTLTGAEEAQTSGLSDPEVQALVMLWSSPFSADLGRRSKISLEIGTKTPWGQNELALEGGRADEHAQPGTGSTDVFGGFSMTHLLDSRSSMFGSIQVRRTGTNRYAYRYGDILLANLSYERRLARRLDGVIELNYRTAARDRIDDQGSRDPNTGGAVLYASPRMVFNLGNGLVARARLQFPVANALFGDQTEKAVVTVGLTRQF